MGVYFMVMVLLARVAVTDGVLDDLSGYKDLITMIHNFYRSYERAADMKELTWDPYLQTRAEKWSENCYWDHQREGLGENLAYFWTNGHADMTTLEVILKSSQNWWKEVNDWHWSTDCGQACHYTQMIWGSTERIGCALSKCANLRTDSGKKFNDAEFFVCFYDPPGNFVGRHPYTLGESCTRCAPDEICKGGLCAKPTTNLPETTTSKTVSPVVWKQKSTANESSRVLDKARIQKPAPRESSGILDKIRIQKGKTGGTATYIQNVGGRRKGTNRTAPRNRFVRRIFYTWTF